MSLSERLVQLTIRAKDYLTRDVKPATDAMKELAQEGARLKTSLADASAARSLARTLRDNKQATEGLQQAFNDAKATLEDLTREVGDNEKATAGQRIAIREARRTLEQAEQAYKRNQSAIKNTTSELKRLGVDTADIVNEEKRLTAEIAQNKEALQQNRVALKEKSQEEAKAAKAAAEHAAQTGKVTGALESAGKKVLGFAAAYLSLNAAMGLVRGGLRLIASGIESVLTVGDSFEKLDKRFASLMGSMAEGEKATAWIRKFADDTGQRVPEVAEAFAMLKSYGLDPLDGSMQAITDKAAQLGGGLEVMQGITMALGQMWAKEKIQQEEVLQLVERGVSVWPMLSKALGKTVPELQALAQQGKLGRDAIKVLIDEIGKSANGQAAGALDTLAGKANVLRNAFEDFARNIAQSGAMDAVKDRLQGLADKLNEMADDGSLDRLAQKLSDAFVDAVDWVEDLSTKVASFDLKGWANDAAEGLSNFRQKLDLVARAVELTFAPIRAMKDLWTITTGSMVAQTLRVLAVMQESAAFMAKAWPDVLGGKAIKAALDESAAITRDAMSRINSAVDESADGLKSNWRSVTGQARASADETAQAFIDAHKRVTDELGKQSQDIEWHIRNNLTGLDNALAAIAFSETVEHLDEVRRAIFAAGDAGLMTAKEMAQALDAIDQRKPLLTLVEGAEKAGDAIARLRNEQAALATQYQEGAISLQAWQDGHNALTQQIYELGQGTTAAVEKLTSFQQAQDALSSAKSVAELEALKNALFAAYQNKDLTLDQFQTLHNEAVAIIKKLGGAAKNTAVDIAGLEDALGNLEKVQHAISSARTDVDITKLRAALKKLYEAGKIDAQQYAKAQADLNQKVGELKAEADKSTKAVKEQGKALKEATSAGTRGMRDTADATDEASASVDFFGRVLTAAREPLAAMSKKALELFDAMRGIKPSDLEMDLSSAEKSAEALAKVKDEVHGLTAEMAQISGKDWGFGIWARQTIRDSKEVQAKFLEQKVALQQLNEQYAKGAISTQQFARSAQTLRGTLDLLDEADLSQLDASIASAQQRMQQLGQSSRQTLESLQDELDKLEGRESDIEARRMAARKRELEAQLAEAQAGGDNQAVADLQKAMQTLAQIQTVTEQQAINERTKKLVEERAQQAQPQQQAPAKQVIRLESKGKSVEVAVGSDSDQTALLKILEDAGLRSIG